MSKLLFFKIIIFLLLLGGCDNITNQPLNGSIDRTGKQIITTIYFYDTLQEVHDKYREIHNLPKDAKLQGLQGFARWPEFRDEEGKPIERDNQSLTCVIHTLKPTKIDDDATLTLGHEMLHCIIGTYHPEQ